MFSAIAFDLDGTLYPNFRFYTRLVPFLFREHRLLRAFGGARTKLREEDRLRDSPASPRRTGLEFYREQARIMGEILSEDPRALLERTERLIYRGWEPLFGRLKLFPHARETLAAFKKSGLKLGILSDFPLKAKLENLKLAGLWDAEICSELIGHLKPHPAPFLELARLLETRPEEILYVGNSLSYDVGGAHKAGMKAAHIRSRWKTPRRPGGRTFGNAAPPVRGSLPDFIFHDYRQLRDYVLG